VWSVIVVYMAINIAPFYKFSTVLKHGYQLMSCGNDSRGAIRTGNKTNNKNVRIFNVKLTQTQIELQTQ